MLIEELRGFPQRYISSGVKLQKGAGVDKFFRALLTDPYINRFEPRYTSMGPLYQRWAKEIDLDVQIESTETAGADGKKPGCGNTI